MILFTMPRHQRPPFMLRVGTAVLALAIVSPVFAQAPAPAAKVSPEVQKHFALGNDYYQEGKYASALSEYEKAYDLSLDEKGKKNWKILYNRGQCLVMLGREPEAIDSFQRYLDEGGDQIDAARRAQVENDIKKLRDRLGTITLEGTAPHGAEVFLDGRFMGKMPLPGPIVAASGFHDLVIKPPGGGPPYVATVKIESGERVAHRVVMTAGGPTAPAGPVPYVDTPPPPPPPPPKLPPRPPGGLTAPSFMFAAQLGLSVPTQDYRYGSSKALGAVELAASWRASGFWELGIFGGFGAGRYSIDDRARGDDFSVGQLKIDPNAGYTHGILGVRARMHLVRAKNLDGWLGVDFGGWGESWRFTGDQHFKYGASSVAFAIGFGADYALSERWALGLAMRFLQASASNGKRSECTGTPIDPAKPGDYCSLGFLPGEGAGGAAQSTARGFVEFGLRLVYLIPTGDSARPAAPAPAARPVTASNGALRF